MNRISVTMAFVWLALLALFCGTTGWNLLESAKAPPPRQRTLFRERVHDELLAHCAFHDTLIHLCGGWARLTGRRLCNGVVRSPDGILVDTCMPYGIMQDKAESLRSLCTRAQQAGKNMLYVQFPRKIDRNGSMMPAGFARDWSHETIDQFLKTLEAFHVPCLDLRGPLDTTPDDVKRFFFKTDHHWTFEGAFRVFPAVAGALAKAAGCETVDISPYVEPAAWERRVLPRKFLGSDGRRTGALFAGTDGMAYYMPKFDTSIQRVVPSKGIVEEGPFDASVCEFQFARKPASMFQDQAYSLYGRDYDYVSYRNKAAPLKKRLLIAKDSFALPLVAWLATLFERVDVVDLRYYRQMTLAEAMSAFDSDVVAVMYNPAVVSAPQGLQWQFGCGTDPQSRPRPYPPCDILVPASNHPYNHVSFGEELAPNGLYRISVESVEIIAGRTDKATMSVLDKTTGKNVNRQTVPLTETEWIVGIPGDHHGYALQLYAGEIGKCAGIGAVWHNVVLSRIR